MVNFIICNFSVEIIKFTLPYLESGEHRLAPCKLEQLTVERNKRLLSDKPF